MINYDYITTENIEEQNPNWTQIFDHPYRILILEGSGSGKTNAIIVFLIKFVCMLKIQMKQNINTLLKKVKKESSEKHEKFKGSY